MENQKQKAVFITLPEMLIARNVFYTEFWPVFLKEIKGIEIVVLVHANKEEVYRKRLEAPGVQIQAVTPKQKGIWNRIGNVLAINGIDTHTNHWEKMRAYADGRSSALATFAKYLITKVFGRSAWYKRLVRRILLLVPSDPSVSAVFDAHDPSGLMLTSLTNYDFDVPIGREARRRGIPIVGMPRSWDNFTSHGLLRILPDTLIVQNRFLKEASAEPQAIPKETPVHVVGLPHYDAYTRASEFVATRKELYARNGLDPRKSLILYGAMGDYLFPHEGQTIPTLERVLGSSGLGEQAQVLFRAHPHFASPLNRTEGLQHVYPDQFALRVDRKDASQEFDNEQIEHLISSLYWSEVVVTSASTFAIDAVAMGKRAICIAYDLGQRVDHWKSNMRFYDQYTHFEALVETGGVEVVRSDQELESALLKCMQPETPENISSRKKLLELFVEPFDGHSGERLAKIAAKSLLVPKTG